MDVVRKTLLLEWKMGFVTYCRGRRRERERDHDKIDSCPVVRINKCIYLPVPGSCFVELLYYFYSSFCFIPFSGGCIIILAGFLLIALESFLVPVLHSARLLEIQTRDFHMTRIRSLQILEYGTLSFNFHKSEKMGENLIILR